MAMEPELWEGVGGTAGVLDQTIDGWIEENLDEFTDESVAAWRTYEMTTTTNEITPETITPPVEAPEAASVVAEPAEPQAETPAEEPAKPVRMPTAGDLLALDNGLYLPVRKRVQWLRQTPGPNPAWTIRTTLHEATFSPGTPGPGGRKGGFALVYAEVIDENGRLIATGHGSEWSERFENFIEAAETAAVGRALALAGYGTDAALDEAHIVDAPTKPTNGRSVPAGPLQVTVNVTPTQVGEVRQGGRSAMVTKPQIEAIRRLGRDRQIGVRAMAKLMRELGIDVAASRESISAKLEQLTFEQAAALIKALEE